MEDLKTIQGKQKAMNISHTSLDNYTSRWSNGMTRRSLHSGLCFTSSKIGRFKRIALLGNLFEDHGWLCGGCCAGIGPARSNGVIYMRRSDKRFNDNLPFWNSKRAVGPENLEVCIYFSCLAIGGDFVISKFW